MNAYIESVGVYLPETIVTNDDISKFVDTNDEWIRTRSGIRERRVVKDDSIRTVDIAAAAALDALKRAGVDPTEVDGIIAGSMYPDQQFPPIACSVQKKIGCGRAFGFDITAACAFIPYALNTAALMIKAGQAKKVLVIGAEISSRIMDWKDRGVCVLFGDGAGALLVSATEDESRGFVGSALNADGKYDHILYLNHLGGPDAYLRMDGTAVFKLAVTEMSAIIKQALDQAGLKPEDIDLLVPHQANIRIIDSVGTRLGLPPEKVMVNVDRYGNTSSASIPIALYEAVEQGRLKPGMLVAFVAIGGGMTWGCNLIRW